MPHKHLLYWSEAREKILRGSRRSRAGSTSRRSAVSASALLGYPALGLAGFFVAGLLGIGLALGILRSGRL